MATKRKVRQPATKRAVLTSLLGVKVRPELAAQIREVTRRAAACETLGGTPTLSDIVREALVAGLPTVEARYGVTP